MPRKMKVMGIKTYRPYTETRRFQTGLTFEEITTSQPYKPLLEPKTRISGRNNQGEITIWRRGGGHKRHYRVIDFKRDKTGVPARVATIEYDPNRSAFIALLSYADGDKRYILYPQGLKVGDHVVSGPEADIVTGNALPLKNIPVGTMIHNIELRPGKGGQMVRSAGGAAQLLAKEGDYAQVRLPSGEVRKVFIECVATIGQTRKPGPRKHLHRQGRPQALDGNPSHGARRCHEPGGSSAGRRRRQDLRWPPSRDALGPADARLQDTEQQVYGPLHCQAA